MSHLQMLLVHMRRISQKLLSVNQALNAVVRLWNEIHIKTYCTELYALDSCLFYFVKILIPYLLPSSSSHWILYVGICLNQTEVSWIPSSLFPKLFSPPRCERGRRSWKNLSLAECRGTINHKRHKRITEILINLSPTYKKGAEVWTSVPG